MTIGREILSLSLLISMIAIGDVKATDRMDMRKKVLSKNEEKFMVATDVIVPIALGLPVLLTFIFTALAVYRKNSEDSHPYISMAAYACSRVHNMISFISWTTYIGYSFPPFIMFFTQDFSWSNFDYKVNWIHEYYRGANTDYEQSQHQHQHHRMAENENGNERKLESIRQIVDYSAISPDARFPTTIFLFFVSMAVLLVFMFLCKRAFSSHSQDIGKRTVSLTIRLFLAGYLGITVVTLNEIRRGKNSNQDSNVTFGFSVISLVFLLFVTPIILAAIALKTDGHSRRETDVRVKFGCLFADFRCNMFNSLRVYFILDVIQQLYESLIVIFAGAYPQQQAIAIGCSHFATFLLTLAARPQQNKEAWISVIIGEFGKVGLMIIMICGKRENSHSFDSTVFGWVYNGTSIGLIIFMFFFALYSVVKLYLSTRQKAESRSDIIPYHFAGFINGKWTKFTPDQELIVTNNEGEATQVHVEHSTAQFEGEWADNP